MLLIQIGDVEDLREAVKELDSEDKEEDEVRWRGHGRTESEVNK